jgi:hypothetical protein
VTYLHLMGEIVGIFRCIDFTVNIFGYTRRDTDHPYMPFHPESKYGALLVVRVAVVEDDISPGSVFTVIK